MQTKKNSPTTSKNPSQNIKQHKHKIHVQRKLHKNKNLQKQKHYVLKFQIIKSDLKSQILG
jgi:hypothetical protein